jgi:hypothetical protein
MHVKWHFSQPNISPISFGNLGWKRGIWLWKMPFYMHIWIDSSLADNVIERPENIPSKLKTGPVIRLAFYMDYEAFSTRIESYQLTGGRICKLLVKLYVICSWGAFQNHSHWYLYAPNLPKYSFCISIPSIANLLLSICPPKCLDK